MMNGADHLKIMSKEGKTFYFASRWLCPEIRNQVAIAYQFCRMVDDIADQVTDLKIREESLAVIYNTIASGSSNNPAFSQILELVAEFPEIQSPLLKLISMCRDDVPGRVIKTEAELFDYAQGVAGTVGLLMYPILGGTLPEGQTAAATLGVAMQYSNIARDVMRDFEENRQYLPKEWLNNHELKDILSTSGCMKLGISRQEGDSLIVAAVRKLLNLADEYYEQGINGLVYLKPRNRFAIRVAARCYQAIGRRVITSDKKINLNRAVVPLREKCLITISQARWISNDLLAPRRETQAL